MDAPPKSAIRSVTVYCSASSEVAPVYLQTAFDLGKAIGESGWTLVYGGNLVGCMGETAKGARSARGKVVGVSPRIFADHHDLQCDELVVTDNMRDRKRILEERADAIVALPGGLGTYEELFEQIVARQLRYHEKPILALNLNGFYDPLRALLQHGMNEKFIKLRAGELLTFCPTIEAIIQHLKHPTVIAASKESLSHEAAGGR